MERNGKERKRGVKSDFPSLAECDIEYISPSEYQSSSKNEDDGSAASKKGSPTSNGYVDPYESLVRGNLERLEKEKVSMITPYQQILSLVNTNFGMHSLSGWENKTGTN